MRHLARRVLPTILLAYIGGGALHAAPVTWVLNNVTFTDGGRAFGSFVYDADTFTYSSINITTTKGTAVGGTAFTFTNILVSSATLGLLNKTPIEIGTTTHLTLNFASTISNAGGSVSFITAGPNAASEGLCLNINCGTFTSLRTITAGSVMASPASKRTWYLSNVKFADGAQANGSFDFDANSGAASNYNIFTTDGAGLSARIIQSAHPTATSATSVLAASSSPIVVGSTHALALILGAPMTAAGGTISISAGGEYVCQAAGCPSAAPSRVVVSGNLTTVAPIGYTKVLSQIADGGGFISTIVLSNTTALPITSILSLYGNDGQPIGLPLTETFNDWYRFVTIPAHATKFLTSPGGIGSTTVGTARVENAAQLGVMATYRLVLSGIPDSEASVSGDTPGNIGFTMPYDETGGFSTGFAILNPSKDGVTAFFYFYDETGAEIYTDSVSFPANGHTSFMIQDRFPAVGHVRGNVRVYWAAPAPGVLPPKGLTAIGLRVNPSNTFTALQVVPQTY